MGRYAVALAVLTALVCASLSSVYADSAARLSGNHPIDAEHRAVMGNMDEAHPLAMTIHLKLRNQRRLDRFLADVQNPRSAQYRKFLQRGEFDRKFGPLKSDIDAVADWLRGEGFSVTSASDSVQFTGMVAQAERTFAVHILKLSASDYSNMEDPVVPARFASLIGNIEGLDNLTHFDPVTRGPTKPHIVAPSSHKLTRAEALSKVTGGVSALASAQPDVVINDGLSYGDVDMRNTYDVSSSSTIGSGDCIAIVGISDYLDGALTAFSNQFSDLPAFNVTRVIVGGTNPGRTGGGNEAEAEIDLEWSHVIAPGAPTHFYLSSDLQSNITQAVNDDVCKVISISFEFCGNTKTFYTTTLDNLFVKAAGQGQSVFISTGDHGAAGSVASGGHCVAGSSQMVSEMAADPNVTAVGGTQILSPDYDQNDVAQGYATESVWNDAESGHGGSGATGGGASGDFTKPSYQTGPGVPGDNHRYIPDVAMLSGFPRVFYGDDSGGIGIINCCEGGTSLAAPIWAGIAKDIESQVGPLGSINTNLYKLANQQYGVSATPNGFHDITSGDNSFNGVTGFSAGTAYDQATGWGSVDVQTFAAAFAGTLPTPTATATATASATATMTIAATGTPTATATMTATATFTPTPVLTTTLAGSPAQISFGNVDASSSSKPRRAMFINKGTNAASLGVVTVPTGFALTADACSNQTVLARKNCAVMVEFSPLTPTPSSGPMSVSYNGAAPASINLSGNGTAVSVKGPARFAFPVVAAGATSVTKSVLITNESRTATVTMGAMPTIVGDFNLASDTCSNQSIGPRGRCAIGLQFAPPIGSTSKSTLMGTLSLSFTYGSNPGTVPSIALSGRVR
ncbi:MAG TPA: S53 family peptidase [Candidatus Binataceae bacterium]|nr:S53 family peptidase [Candidatus Binataceae bacterium]